MIVRIAFIIFLAFPFNSYALHLFSFREKSIFQGWAEIFKDTTSTFEIENVIDKRNLFVQNTEKNIWVDNVASTYWYKFKPSKADEAGGYYFVSYFKHESIILYAVDSSNEIIYKGNPIYFDFKFWDIKYRKQVINVPIFKNVTYYVKVKPRYLLPLAIEVRTRSDFINIVISEYFYYGLFFGILFIVIIYNSILFIISKEYLYLFYSLYIFCFSFYGLVEWELLTVFVGYTFMDSYFFNIPYSLTTVFLMAYMLCFLGLENKKSWVWRTFIVLIVTRLIIEILAILKPDLPFTDSQIDLGYILVSYILGGYIIYKNKDVSGYYFLLAYTFTLASFYVHSYIHMDIASVFDKEAFYLFGLTGITLFAAAQAQRYSAFKRAKEGASQQMIEQLKINDELKDKVNRELEGLVEDRTSVIIEQAQKIATMNELLQEHNIRLQEDVKTISKDRVLSKQVSFEDFKLSYPNDEECYKFLVNLKWEKGFKCLKCKHTFSSEGPILFSKRCNQCKYIETPTSHTIFHRLRFPLVKAFYIMFLMYSRKEITIDELSKMIDLRAATCHAFKQKVVLVMAKKKKNKNSEEGWSFFILEN